MASVSMMSVMDKTSEILSEFNTELLLFGMAFIVQFAFISKPWRKKSQKSMGLKDDGDRSGPMKAVSSAFEQRDYRAVLRYWRIIQTSDAGEISTNIMVQVLESMQRLKKDTASILEEVESVLTKNRAYANVTFMNELIAPVSKSLDVDLVVGMLHLFNDQLVEANSTTYESLAHLFFATRNLVEVKKLSVTMHTDGIKPTGPTSLCFLKAFLAESDLQESLNCLGELCGMQLPAAVASQLLRLACRERCLCDVLPKLEAARLPMSTEMLNTALTECLRVKEDGLTSAVLKAATSQGVTKGGRTYSLMVKLAGGNRARISQILDEALSSESRTVLIDNLFVQAVLEACSEMTGDLILVERLADALKPGEPSQVPAILSIIRFYADAGYSQKACKIYTDLLRPEEGKRPPLDARTKGCLLSAAQASGRHDLVEELGEMSGSPNHISLLRSCSKKCDASTAISVCERAEKLPAGAWNIALETCIDQGDLSQASELLEKMGDKGVADVNSFSMLLKAYLRLGNVSSALGLLEKMQKDPDLTPNSNSYNEIIASLLKDGCDSSRAKSFQLIDAMKEEGLKPSKSLIGILLKSLKPKSIQADIAQVMRCVDSWANAMDEGLLCNVLETCVRLRKLQLLEQKLREYYGTENPVNISGAHCFGTIIKAFGLTKNPAGAWRCWKRMCSQHVKPTPITIGCMVEAVSINGDVEGAHELIKTLLEDAETRTAVNAVVFGSIFKGFSRAGRMDRVWAAFQEMKAHAIEPSIMTFNAIIDGCARNAEMDKAGQLIVEMKSCGLQPNIITQSTLIKGYWALGNAQQAFEAFEETEKGSDTIDDALYSTMFDGCLQGGLADECEWLVEKMIAQPLSPSTYTLTAIVKTLTHAKRLHKAFKVVETLQKQFHHRMATSVNNLLLKGCLKLRAYELGARACIKMMNDRYVLDSSVCHSLLRGLLQIGQSHLACEMIELMLTSRDSRPADSLEDSLISEVVLTLRKTAPFAADQLCEQLRSVRPTFKLAPAEEDKGKEGQAVSSMKARLQEIGACGKPCP
eukprot:TRINITY_DN22353_c0_g1_i1.p1 TRINITY_DN22353_c0_g1~~TRINITY_DN22353_c0_g1_i1.p1  ORF type:complete len:1042 (+),score=205.20 TRINITY_DN22353_c0_g1_i1:140-3265(+)